MKAAELLIERDANVNLGSKRKQITPLLAACVRGSVEHAQVIYFMQKEFYVQ